MLIKLFGKQYALNESLVYSLQLSQLRTKNQIKSSRSLLSKDSKSIVDFVTKYRSGLSDDIYNSQEYSIKLLQIPKVANTDKADLAIEFVRFDELSDDDTKIYNKIDVLVKDRKVKMEGSNVGKLKPGKVKKRVNKILGDDFLNFHYHTCIYTVFSVRPPANTDDPFETNTDYCHYDEPHNDYVYNEDWVRFIIHIFQTGLLSKERIKEYYDSDIKLDIEEYEP